MRGCEAREAIGGARPGFEHVQMVRKRVCVCVCPMKVKLVRNYVYLTDLMREEVRHRGGTVPADLSTTSCPWGGCVP